jgi:hypothetical protein
MLHYVNPRHGHLFTTGNGNVSLGLWYDNHEYVVTESSDEKEELCATHFVFGYFPRLFSAEPFWNKRKFPENVIF